MSIGVLEVNPFHILASLFFLACLGLSRLFTPRTKKSPALKELPGPWGLPWFGPIWDVDGTHIWLTFTSWAKQYGSIYKVTIAGQHFVCISDEQICKDVLAKQGAVASDRPQIASIRESKGDNHFGEYMPFLGSNDSWKMQRKFGALVSLEANRQSYHGYVEPEVRKMISELHFNKNKKDYVEVFEHYLARIACSMAYGSPDSATAIRRNANNLMTGLSPGGRITNVLRFLNKLPLMFNAETRFEAKRHSDEVRLWYGLFDDAKAKWEQGELGGSYMRHYLENPATTQMDDANAVYIIATMATVSILTLEAPMGWFVCGIADKPEWQKAVQDEIKRVCGDRMPELKDQPDMPILRAVVVETLRWGGLAPTGIPHTVTQDVDYNGYKIAKDTRIMAVDWAIARNPTMYPDAETYNPGRYLDSSFPTYKEPLTEFPSLKGQHCFGFGRRTCVGQDHAACVLFLAMGAFLWAFDAEPAILPNGERAKMEMTHSTANVIAMPAAQKVVFKARNVRAIEELEI